MNKFNQSIQFNQSEVGKKLSYKKVGITVDAMPTVYNTGYKLYCNQIDKLCYLFFRYISSSLYSNESS